MSALIRQVFASVPINVQDTKITLEEQRPVPGQIGFGVSLHRCVHTPLRDSKQASTSTPFHISICNPTALSDPQVLAGLYWKLFQKLRISHVHPFVVRRQRFRFTRSLVTSRTIFWIP